MKQSPRSPQRMNGCELLPFKGEAPWLAFDVSMPPTGRSVIQQTASAGRPALPTCSLLLPSATPPAPQPALTHHPELDLGHLPTRSGSWRQFLESNPNKKCFGGCGLAGGPFRYLGGVSPCLCPHCSAVIKFQMKHTSKAF